MLHFKNKGYSPKHAREVIYKARDLTSDMNVSVRVARIATKFVEFDVGDVPTWASHWTAAA